MKKIEQKGSLVEKEEVIRSAAVKMILRASSMRTRKSVSSINCRSLPLAELEIQILLQFQKDKLQRSQKAEARNDNSTKKGAISFNVDKAIFSKASVVTQLLTMRMDQTLCTRYER